MNISNYKKTILGSLLAVSGFAHANDTYIIVGGNFDFYDASGVYQAGASHNAVVADGILAEDPGTGYATSMPVDFTNKTGRLVPGAKFNGVSWVADINGIETYDASVGGVQSKTYSWTVNTMWDGVNPFVTQECLVAGSINGCAYLESLGWQVGASSSDSYVYTLNEGQFAFHMFFDWTAPSNEDIPVLAVFEITDIDSNGNITAVAVDSDNDGIPGTRMATAPFPNQTPAFSGVFRPVTKDVVLSGGALTTNEDTPLNVAKADFDKVTTAFPASLIASANTSLSIGSGTGYTTDGSGVITPNLNYDIDLTVPVSLSMSNHNGLTYLASTSNHVSVASLTSSGATATVTINSHGLSTGDTVTIVDAAQFEYNGTYTITVTDPDTFTYTFGGSSTSTATGNIVAIYVSTSSTSMAYNATVDVVPQNDAPEISCSYPSSAPVGDPYSSTPATSDPEDSSLSNFAFTSDATATLPANTLPTGMSFNTSTGEISGTPTILNEESGNVVVTVTDSNAASTSCPAFTLTTTGPNTPPGMISATPALTIDEDSSYSFDVDCTDPDAGEIISYFLSGQPSWMSINTSTGLITGTPANADVATTTGITVGCRDNAGAGSSSDIVFDLTVNNTNDAPTIDPNTCVDASVESGSAFSCSVTANDVDAGDDLTFSATGLPASLSIDTNTGSISGNVTASDVGTHVITVSVTDTGGPVTTSAPDFILTVTAFNEPPVVQNALFKTPVDTQLSDSLAAYATDPENCGCLVFRKDPLNQATAFGSVQVNPDGSFVYTPNTGFNGTDSFSFIASDDSRDSVKATVQIIVGKVKGETYAGSNFTMLDASGDNANGGTNDVIASWDGLFNTDESDTDFSHMTLSSKTPYFGELWTAHHIRVYGPGTYTFDTTCTVQDIEAGITNCQRPLELGQTERYLTMTVEQGQIGAHILFDWSVNLNIDVVNVWNVNAKFDVSNNPGSGVLYNGEGYGPFPWSGAPSADTTWRLASHDADGDGIPGIPMVDGKFIGFNANFNLDIVSTGSNFTMLDASGDNANGGTNDVVASWDGLFNTDESDTDFSHMTLSSKTPYFGELWKAHHIRVYGPGTYTFDTTCTVQDLEAGITNCQRPLEPGQTERYLTMTIEQGQIGAHILFDWSVNLNIDVVNVWNVNAKFDVSNNPGSGVLYNGEGYGPYPWSGAPSADTKWRLVSFDGDGDGIPGIPMVDGKFIGFNANFNLFVGSGSTCVPSADNNFCGTKETNEVVDDPDLGAGNAFSLLVLSLMWMGLMYGYRSKQFSQK